MELRQASASRDTRPFHQSLEMTAWHSGFSLTCLQGVPSILLQQTASLSRPCTGKPGNVLLGDICMPCQHTSRMTETIFINPSSVPHKAELHSHRWAGEGGCLKSHWSYPAAASRGPIPVNSSMGILLSVAFSVWVGRSQRIEIQRFTLLF